jgi:DNA-binding FrmR family transcriptional regulator
MLPVFRSSPALGVCPAVPARAADARDLAVQLLLGQIERGADADDARAQREHAAVVQQMLALKAHEPQAEPSSRALEAAVQTAHSRGVGEYRSLLEPPAPAACAVEKLDAATLKQRAKMQLLSMLRVRLLELLGDADGACGVTGAAAAAGLAQALDDADLDTLCEDVLKQLRAADPTLRALLTGSLLQEWLQKASADAAAAHCSAVDALREAAALSECALQRHFRPALAKVMADNEDEWKEKLGAVSAVLQYAPDPATAAAAAAAVAASAAAAAAADAVAVSMLVPTPQSNQMDTSVCS